MKRRTIIAVVLMIVISLAVSQNLFAEEKKLEFNSSYGIKEFLSANTGKRVTIKTDSGEALEGTVAKVGDHLLHIEKLSGKDFYDAVVRIDKISTVTIRVRGPQ